MKEAAEKVVALARARLIFDLPTARRLVLTVLASMNPAATTDLATVESNVRAYYGRERGQTTPGPSGDWRACLGRNGSAFVFEFLWDSLFKGSYTHTRQQCNSKVNSLWAVVVKEQRWSPYDPDGYLKELSIQAPTLSSHCRMYAAEALQCLRGGCYLATVVMLELHRKGIVIELFCGFVAALKAGGVSEASKRGEQDREGAIHLPKV